MMTQENGQLPVDIVLDVDDGEFVSDELYDLLLDAFVAKANAMGYDIDNTPQLVLGEWTLKAKLEVI